MLTSRPAAGGHNGREQVWETSLLLLSLVIYGIQCTGMKTAGLVLLVFVGAAAEVAAFLPLIKAPSIVNRARIKLNGVIKALAGDGTVTDRRDVVQKWGIGLGLLGLQQIAGVPTIARAEDAITSDYIFPNVSEPAFTSTCFLDLESNGKALGRVEISLYGDVVPKTSENFERLCSGEGGTYSGSQVYRVLKDFQISAGDIGSKKKGMTGQSSFGKPFPKENLRIQHNVKGIVSMVNDLKGLNDSRFFVLMASDGGWADNRYTAFGRVTKGLDILEKLEKTDVSPGNNAPNPPVKIVNCGVMPRGGE